MNYTEILFLIIIVMQRNCTKHFSGGVHYPDAIFLMAIIWGYISVVNIILRGNSLSASCLRANYLGDNFRLAIFGGQLSGGHLSWGAIVRGAIIQGAIVLLPLYHKQYFLRDIFTLQRHLTWYYFFLRKSQKQSPRGQLL